MQVNIDPTLKRALQIAAIKQGITMAEANERAIKFWLKQQQTARKTK